MPVDLPQATQSTTVNDVGQFIVLSVVADCSEGPDACVTDGWYIEQTEVGETTLLDAVNEEYRQDALNAQMRGETPTSRSLLIKGDHRLPYREVRKVMDLLAAQGMTTLMVAAKKED